MDTRFLAARALLRDPAAKDLGLSNLDLAEASDLLEAFGLLGAADRATVLAFARIVAETGEPIGLDGAGFA